MHRRIALALVALLSLSSCYRASAERPTLYSFGCEQNYPFTVQFQDDLALLTLPDRTVRLPQVVSGSGARYSDGNVTFWNKGNTARLWVGDRVYEECRTAQ